MATTKLVGIGILHCQTIKASKQTNEEHDLGIILTSDLKFSTQFAIFALKQTQFLVC